MQADFRGSNSSIKDDTYQDPDTRDRNRTSSESNLIARLGRLERKVETLEAQVTSLNNEIDNLQKQRLESETHQVSYDSRALCDFCIRGLNITAAIVTAFPISLLFVALKGGFELMEIAVSTTYDMLNYNGACLICAGIAALLVSIPSFICGLCVGIFASPFFACWIINKVINYDKSLCDAIDTEFEKPVF